MTARPTSAERLAWLRLARSENVGPRTFRDLIVLYGGAQQALDILPELSRRGGLRRPVRLLGIDQAQAEIERTAELGARIVTLAEPDYPPALRHIDDAPPILTVMGRLEVAARPVVAIVGARNASALGIRMASMIAADLGQNGYVIASGLARGIDTAAHRASSTTGTIAVVAGGIDVAYPPENAELQAHIAETGLVMSEVELGAQPVARHFPRRNRLVSGIASGVVVVEAARRSGSLITARMALEQGREVFAVPGSPLDPRSEGANALIRDGATLVRHADDVIEALRPMLGNLSERSEPDRGSGNIRPERPPLAADDLRDAICSLIGFAPTPIDEIIRQSGAGASEVAVVLLELDLAGRLTRHGGQLVSLSPAR